MLPIIRHSHRVKMPVEFAKSQGYDVTEIDLANYFIKNNHEFENSVYFSPVAKFIPRGSYYYLNIHKLFL